MLPTVADVLAFDIVRRGRPRIVAGEAGVDNHVRWVHVSELADIAHLLRGGELVLTTGIALPDEAAGLEGYVGDLAEAGVSGLMIELGRRYPDALPEAMIKAADSHRLPLIALHREVRFVSVTEAVHGKIINVQLEQLRASEQLHETFTELSVRGATPSDVVSEVARLAGRPTVLENLAHQVLAAAGGDPGELLAGWEERSRRVALTGRTGYDDETALLVTTVGARDEDWGRLALVCDEPPASAHTMLIERAATTLALGRLIERDQDSLVRQAHRTLISGILSRSYTDDELTARAQALGVPLAGRQLVGIAIRSRGDTGASGPGDQSRLRAQGEALARAAAEADAAALVGSLDEHTVAALVTARPSATPGAVIDQIAGTLRRTVRADIILGAGSVVTSAREVRRSLQEARQVADVARGFRGDQSYYRLADLGVRGLVHLLCDDTRVQTFVERQLGPLLAHDARHPGKMLSVLDAYLRSGGNKSAAAAAVHLSRPAMYERLDRIERVLGVRLDDPEQRTSLHLALLALDAARTP